MIKIIEEYGNINISRAMPDHRWSRRTNRFGLEASPRAYRICWSCTSFNEFATLQRITLSTNSSNTNFTGGSHAPPSSVSSARQQRNANAAKTEKCRTPHLYIIHCLLSTTKCLNGQLHGAKDNKGTYRIRLLYYCHSISALTGQKSQRASQIVVHT
jgi:hypothetical protein